MEMAWRSLSAFSSFCGENGPFITFKPIQTVRAWPTLCNCVFSVGSAWMRVHVVGAGAVEGASVPFSNWPARSPCP